MVNEWTRDDLPAVMDLVKASVDAMATDPSGGAYAALDAVVAHLNEHHPKPVAQMPKSVPAPESPRTAAMAVAMTHSALERMDRLADERDGLRRERDAAVARADQLRDERDDAVQSCITVGRDRDEWKARAEAAETRTAVTRADIEKAIRGKVWAKNREPNKAGFHLVHVDWATDAVCGLFGVEAGQATDPVEDAVVAAFKAAWHRADEEGDEGNRVRRGIRAARHVLGQEANDE